MSLAAALRDECIVPVVGEDLIGADGVLFRAEHAPLHGVAEVLVVRILHRLGELRPTEVVVEDELPVGDGAVGVALHVAAVKEPAAPLVALDEDPVAVLQRDGLDRRLFAVCLVLCRCGCGDGGFIRRVFAARCLARLVLLPSRLVRIVCVCGRLGLRRCRRHSSCARLRCCRCRSVRLRRLLFRRSDLRHRFFCAGGRLLRAGGRCFFLTADGVHLLVEGRLWCSRALCLLLFCGGGRLTVCLFLHGRGVRRLLCRLVRLLCRLVRLLGGHDGVDLCLLFGSHPAGGEEEDSCGEQAGDGFHSVSFFLRKHGWIINTRMG